MLGREAPDGREGIAVPIVTVEDRGGDAVAQAKVHGAIIGHLSR